MRVPERPTAVSELDLMSGYSLMQYGTASWHSEGQALGSSANGRPVATSMQRSLMFLNKIAHPLLDRVTSREMQGFTMHDHGHGLKVAHLMWHITTPSRAAKLYRLLKSPSLF